IRTIDFVYNIRIMDFVYTTSFFSLNFTYESQNAHPNINTNDINTATSKKPIDYLCSNDSTTVR
ncbi:3660_t:CDS:1, partial [Ambispora leptoticha]